MLHSELFFKFFNRLTVLTEISVKTALIRFKAVFDANSKSGRTFRHQEIVTHNIRLYNADHYNINNIQKRVYASTLVI